jgi:hypothetical protein
MENIATVLATPWHVFLTLPQAIPCNTFTISKAYEGDRMPEQPSPPSFAEYLTVSEAAAFLGVSPWTLRNWDKAGRLKPTRHPKNGYRIYRHEDLAAVLKSAAVHSQRPFQDINHRDHFVQFYESEEFLASSVADYLAAGLLADEAAIIVASEAHTHDIKRQLQARGCDVAAACANGSFVALDAQDTLNQFSADGVIDADAFHEVVGQAIASLTSGSRPLRAFGEMVVLLWMQGKRQAAIQLEELWNQLRQSHPFSLMCGYPMEAFRDSSDAQSLHDVCACHSHVMPAESYAALSDDHAKARAIAALQHKARSLEAEISHRQAVERELMQSRLAAEKALNTKDQLLGELTRELGASLRSVSAMENDPALPPHLQKEAATLRRKIDSLKAMIKPGAMAGQWQELLRD